MEVDGNPEESSEEHPADFRIVDDDVPRSTQSKYTHLPEPIDPVGVFETTDVFGPTAEPGNESTECEWVARDG